MKILVWMIFSSAYGYPAANLDHLLFDTKESCEVAAKRITQQYFCQQVVKIAPLIVSK